MIDELTDETIFTRLPFQKQAELISQHCRTIKADIKQATTFDTALCIMDEQCKQFELHCTSSVIQKAMRKYVQNIIMEKWAINR